MPPALTVLIGFTLLGNALQRGVNMPVPGPLLGVALLLLVARLLLRGGSGLAIRQTGLSVMPAGMLAGAGPVRLLLPWPARTAPTAILVSCPRSSLPFAADAGDRQATENNGLVSRFRHSPMAANFGIGHQSTFRLTGNLPLSEIVMAGLDPAICTSTVPRLMAGTSPAMTA
ncbi:MAG: hypothetical protein P4L71_06285 [Acetobacteraceae bacterium]|nr:hypothetical protein [Acetobacteraceae bacterium]